MVNLNFILFRLEVFGRDWFPTPKTNRTSDYIYGTRNMIAVTWMRTRPVELAIVPVVSITLVFSQRTTMITPD